MTGEDLATLPSCFVGKLGRPKAAVGIVGRDVEIVGTEDEKNRFLFPLDKVREKMSSNHRVGAEREHDKRNRVGRTARLSMSDDFDDKQSDLRLWGVHEVNRIKANRIQAIHASACSESSQEAEGTVRFCEQKRPITILE